MVACGTASYACLVAKYWFEQLAGLPSTWTWPPSSATASRPSRPHHRPLREPVRRDRRHPRGLRYCRDKADRICRSSTSPKAPSPANPTSPPHPRGPEIGVASTQASPASSWSWAPALEAAPTRRCERPAAGRLSLRATPRPREPRARPHERRPHSARRAEARDILSLAGPDVPAGPRSALKLKEISYNPRRGYVAGELKHGPSR
jgi:glucosamine--fructose-6-phosphate aminotransferase (isomerizing)